MAQPLRYAAARGAPPAAWLPRRAWVPRARSVARLLTYVAIAAAAMVPVRLVIETWSGWWRTPSSLPMAEVYAWWGTSVLALVLAVAIAIACRTRRWCRGPRHGPGPTAAPDVR